MPKVQKDKPTVSEEGLQFCNRLFSIECELHDVTPQGRYDARLKFSRPVLDDFKNWLKYQTPRVLPKSALGKAIQYCRNQWDKLEGFMKDGRLEFSCRKIDKTLCYGKKGMAFQ